MSAHWRHFFVDFTTAALMLSGMLLGIG